MMSYEDALQKWGGDKLREWNPEFKADNTVMVVFNFNDGFACCGGRDPDCYCSYAESPSAEVVIEGRGSTTYRIDIEDFDFATILKEIVAAGGGEVGL